MQNKSRLAGTTVIALAVLGAAIATGTPAAAGKLVAAKPLLPNLASYCQKNHAGSRLFYRGAADHWACVAADGSRWHYIDFKQACLMSHQTPHFSHKGRDVRCLRTAAKTSK